MSVRWSEEFLRICISVLPSSFEATTALSANTKLAKFLKTIKYHCQITGSRSQNLKPEKDHFSNVLIWFLFEAAVCGSSTNCSLNWKSDQKWRSLNAKCYTATRNSHDCISASSFANNLFCNSIIKRKSVAQSTAGMAHPPQNLNSLVFIWNKPDHFWDRPTDVPAWRGAKQYSPAAGSSCVITLHVMQLHYCPSAGEMPSTLLKKRVKKFQKQYQNHQNTVCQIVNNFKP